MGGWERGIVVEVVWGGGMDADSRVYGVWMGNLEGGGL